MRLIAVLVAVSGIALAAGSYDPPLPFGPIWADHDTGNVKLSITAHGGVGYTAPDSAGSGLRFPKTMTTSRLYYCGMLCGNDMSYVADRFYGLPAPNLNKDFAIVESLHRDDWYGGQEYSAAMDDSRHANPKSLLVRLHSIALPGSFGNGVMMIYDYWNQGGSPLNGMYAGLWADFDITSGGTGDIATTDPSRRMAMMRMNTTENPCCALMVLWPQTASNLSVVWHQAYVYPTDTCVSESQKIRWLNGTLHQDSSHIVNDFSVVTATGPFDLAAGGGQRVAFAMLAATSRAELGRKADSLQAWFDANVPVGVGEGAATAVFTTLDVIPNPVRGPVRIRFGANSWGGAKLGLYDRSGRLVEQVWSGMLTGKVMDVQWAGDRLENGVYFLRLEGAGVDCTAKAVIAR